MTVTVLRGTTTIIEERHRSNTEPAPLMARVLAKLKIEAILQRLPGKIHDPTIDLLTAIELVIKFFIKGDPD